MRWVFFRLELLTAKTLKNQKCFFGIAYPKFSHRSSFQFTASYGYKGRNEELTVFALGFNFVHRSLSFNRFPVSGVRLGQHHVDLVNHHLPNFWSKEVCRFDCHRGLLSFRYRRRRVLIRITKPAVLVIADENVSVRRIRVRRPWLFPESADTA